MTMPDRVPSGAEIEARPGKRYEWGTRCILLSEPPGRWGRRTSWRLAVLCGFPETVRLVRARLRRYEWRELGRDDVTRLVRKWYGKSAEWRMAGKGTRRWLEPERA